VLLNYHICRFVLGSLCAGDLVRLGLSSVRAVGWSTSTATTQTQPHQISSTQRTENKTTDVVIQQHSRNLLMMVILMSETCWAHKKWNKIASDIKLVFYSSTRRMSVVIYHCLGAMRRCHLRGSSSPSLFWYAWPLNTRPLGCLETSVNNYQSTQRNISEEWKYYEIYALMLHSIRFANSSCILHSFCTLGATKDYIDLWPACLILNSLSA